MANPKGIITRKDIIEDEALKWGDTYAASLQTSIKANKELVDSVKELNKQVQAFKVANSQKDYIKIKQDQALEDQKAIANIKILQAEEIKRQKIEREGIATDEARRKAKQAATDAENKAQKTKEASVKLTIEERIQNEINNKALKQEALERLGLVGAYQKLSKERSDAARKLRDLIAAEGTSTAEIKKAQKEFEVLNKRVRDADSAVGDFTKNVGRYPIGGFVDIIKNLGSAFGWTSVVTAAGAMIKGAYEEVKKFEQGVADLSAITGASGKDLDYLRNSAIELGKGVKGGATAVIEAYKLIGSAKPELLDNVKALNAVTEATLTLAKASGLEMPEAATALTDAMNQFGADADQASVFIDALANGAKYGAAEIPKTTEALLKFGAVARSSNVNIKESTALIQLLAENGIKGADAGTALRNVLLKISAPDALPREAQKAMNDLGISFELLKDKSVPIQQKFEALRPLLADNGKLLKAFGFENTVAARNIIEHTDRLKELTSKMGEFGTAEEQAAIQMNTLQGDTDKMASTYDSLVLSIGKGSGIISNSFRSIAQAITDGLNGLIRFNTSWDELYDKAKNKGISEGIKSFQTHISIGEAQGGNALDVAKNVKSSALETYKRLNEEIKKEEAEIKKRAGDSAYLGFGESHFLKAAKERKEKLLEDINFQVTLIREANKKIKDIENPKTPKGNTAEGTGTVTETDAEKKAREKDLKDKLDAERKMANSLYELQKQRLEQNIKFLDEIAKDDEQADEMRVNAVENRNFKEQKLLELNRDNLLKGEKLTANDKLRINEDFDFKAKELAQKTKNEIDKINQFDEKEYVADLVKKTTNIEIASNKALAIENENYKKKLDNKELSDKEIEDAARTHEEKLFNIKLEASKKLAEILIANIELELEAYKQQSDGSEKSNAFILALEKKLYDAKLKLSELGLQTFEKTEEKKVLTTKEKAIQTLEIAIELTGELSNLANAFSDAKIQKIEDEIAKNNEYYEKAIELAGNDERQKDLLQKERDKKNEALEKKKRAAQHKQAVFDKALNAAMVSMATALAVIKAWTEGDVLTKLPRSILAASIGAIQLAAVLATPIPKYKDGRNGGKEEFAYVGDGGVSEVIERKRGGIEITPATDTLVKLYEGDKVHSSVDAYHKLQRAAMIASIDMQGRKMSDFQATQYFESNNKELLEELKRNTKAIEKQKSGTVVNVPKIDLNHHFWKKGNTNWG